MRQRLAKVLCASAMTLALGACDGHATRNVPQPSQATTRTVIGDGPATVVTKVCGQPIVRLRHVVAPISLNGHGSPVRLRGRADGGHVFRVSHSCRTGNMTVVAPRRCALVVERALAKDERPTAIQVKELCSYRVTVAGHAAAIVTVSRR
jgi:hypothetical protein